jgi:polyhydroxybutyrate depolymerase
MRWLAALLALLAGTAQALALAPGDYCFELKHDGRSRSYLVHVPPKAAVPPPVVLSLHGGGGNADQHRRSSGMDAAADRDGYIAVYPNGSGRLGDRLLTWNAGNCCGYARVQGVDDVGFIAALLDDLARRTEIDRRRIYAVGQSNGGMMAHRLGDELPERVAAIASVAGAYVPSTNGRPLPVLHIHSVDDPVALYAGGLGPPFPLTHNRVLHAAVEDMLSAWVKRDGCGAAPKETEHRESNGQTATRWVYGGCRDGAEVVLWKLTGAGHGWPGTESGREALTGPATRVIDANTEVWRFFSRFSLAP